MKSLKGLWIVLSALTALFLALELPLAYVLPDAISVSWFGFSAVYGFLSCAALILSALVFGIVVKRGDKYYDH